MSATVCVPINKKNKIFVMKADYEDWQELKMFKWHLTHTNHVVRNLSINQRKMAIKPPTLFHRVLLSLCKDKVVDHINRNPLDNRRINLRVCSRKENLRNRNLPPNNTSSFLGVYELVHRKDLKKRWMAKLVVNEIQKCIYCSSFDEAVEARKALELKYFGEFSPHLGDSNG